MWDGASSLVSFSNEFTLRNIKLRDVEREEPRADLELPAGTRIRVSPHGAGSYAGFQRKFVGANRHTIDFDEGGRLVVQLRGLRWAMVDGVLTGRTLEEEEEAMIQATIALSLQGGQATGVEQAARRPQGSS